MMLFVGDRNQAIMGFTGAMNDSMDTIKRDFRCASLPLTVTRRCSKAVVRLAQTIVPTYTAHEDNIEGTVTSMSEDEFFALNLRPGLDTILCRNTAPLVRFAYKLIARGIAAKVEGRDIGSGLVKFVKRFRKAKTILQLTDAIDAYVSDQTAKLSKDKNYAELDRINEQVETVQAIMATLPDHASVAQLIADIEVLFVDAPDGNVPNTVLLMTAHKSKGLEWERVFGLGNERYFPSPFAKQDWQLKQEDNLLYVLWTRAIDTYVDVILNEKEDSR